jgi:hypothetical protein
VKADAAVEELEIRMRYGGVENVLIDVVARARVNQEDVMLKVAVRQPPQPFEPLLPYNLNCPSHDRSGVLVEPLEDLGIGACPIVVADEREPLVLHHLIEAAPGVAAIPDHVAQAKGLVDRWAIAHDGLERMPVGVYVRQDRDLQAGRSYRRG